MKILYFGNKLSKHGYTPTVIEGLSRLLHDEQKSIFVLSSSDKKNKLLRLIDMLLFFFRNKKGADVVLIDTYSTMNFWYAAAIGYLSHIFKIKYIPILHGGNLPQRLEKTTSVAKKLFTYSYVNVAPSNYLYTEFKKRGYENVIIIPNFIDETKYKPIIRKNIDTPSLLWVRSFSEIYNPQMAVLVLDKLKKKYAGARLLMIGGGNNGDECLQNTMALAKRMGLADSIEFTGRLSKEEWILRSKECNIFINTTNVDNTPVSVIEAMSLGFPIVSTNVGGISHIIKDQENGLLVEANDVEGMGVAIERLIEDDSLCEKISQGAISNSIQYHSVSVRKLWFSILQNLNNK